MEGSTFSTNAGIVKPLGNTAPPGDELSVLTVTPPPELEFELLA